MTTPALATIIMAAGIVVVIPTRGNAGWCVVVGMIALAAAVAIECRTRSAMRRGNRERWRVAAARLLRWRVAVSVAVAIAAAAIAANGSTGAMAVASVIAGGFGALQCFLIAAADAAVRHQPE